MLVEVPGSSSERALSTFACPNCGVLIDQSESRSIALGCFVRHARRAEGRHERQLTSALREGPDAPLEFLAETAGELFTPASVHLCALPPILSAMKSTLAEMEKRRPFLDKIVHICDECFDAVADDAELARQHACEQRLLMGPPERRRYQPQPPAVVSSQRVPNRLTDMVFTDLQLDQRRNLRRQRLKQTARERMVTAVAGAVDALDVDWETVPSVAAREARRTGAAVTAELARSRAGAHHEGAARSALPQAGDVPFHGIGDAALSAFDVSFEDRLMADLYQRMIAVCGEFAAPQAGPVPDTHPFFSVFRKQQNRLPAPPQPDVQLELPHYIAGAPADVRRTMGSCIRTTERAPVLEDRRETSVGASLEQMGVGGLTRDELAMLSAIVQDPTIVVPSDDDDDYGSNYDSEMDSDDDGGIY